MLNRRRPQWVIVRCKSKNSPAISLISLIFCAPRNGIRPHITDVTLIAEVLIKCMGSYFASIDTTI